MAGNGNDWNSFMRGRQARLVLNGICTLFCAFYAVDAVRGLIDPSLGGQLPELMGMGGYLALTAIRGLVCLWGAVAFGRMTYQVFREDDKR